MIAQIELPTIRRTFAELRQGDVAIQDGREFIIIDVSSTPYHSKCYGMFPESGEYRILTFEGLVTCIRVD